ncbi:hypothetical protein C5167_047386 [Papaver somniferum]|uniref:Rubisco LSMT substrate-binding domain-containing protein n=1 Tax=Papaver somniferum TaxID=3469 RepID=A0A4Y7LJ08_PAPSO|nr:hypothetical protein C5167_047386 [Papaver somniferum]
MASREKANKDSKWAGYLQILPEKTDSTIFWSEEELSEIQGTQLNEHNLGCESICAQRISQCRTRSHTSQQASFPFNYIRRLLLGIWYTQIKSIFTPSWSRCCSSPSSRLEGSCILKISMTMIYLFYKINHSSSITTENVCWEIKGGGIFSRGVFFSLRTPVSVKSGEQIYIQYDAGKSSAELALDYGFVESKPDRNAYTLTLGISDSDPFLGDKLDIAESNALGGQDAFLLESVFRSAVWGHLEMPISPANEELICRVLRETCKTALSKYATTIEEDEKLLEGGNLSPRLAVALGIRLAEKKILQQIDEVIRNRELEILP